jgi:hypothetical protein
MCAMRTHQEKARTTTVPLFSVLFVVFVMFVV